MRYTAAVIVGLLSLSSAALAQSGANSFPPLPPNVAPYPASLNELHPGTTRLHQNANECAPDLPRAIWGPPGILLGYSCYDNSNG
jgi:hypothetical protein